MAEIMVLAVVAILINLLVLRPLVNRLFAMQISPGPEASDDVVLGPQGQPMLAGPEGGAPQVAAGEMPQLQGEAGLAMAEGGGESAIDLSALEGRVQGSSVKKMGEIIDKHPDEAVSILRGWMAESAH